MLKDWLPDWNLVSASGGLSSHPAGSSKSVIENQTRVAVGDGATVIVTRRDDGSGGDLNLSAHNDVTARDKAKLDTGGALATALAESKIYNDVNTTEVAIGRAALKSQGAVNVSSWADVDLEAQSNVKAYGLAGFARGASVAHASPSNLVTVGDGATVEAAEDVTMTAGGMANDSNGVISVSARTDLWNKTAFPIVGDPDADAAIDHVSSIDVEAGAWIGSSRDVRLDAMGGAHSVAGNWSYQDAYTQTVDALASFFTGGEASFKRTGGSETDNLASNVHIDGVVESGLNSEQFLAIDEEIVPIENPVALHGAPGLTFHSASGRDTITRADGGSWIADGFQAGESLWLGDMEGLSAGFYRIASLTDETITLDATTPLPLDGTGCTIDAWGATVAQGVMTGSPRVSFDYDTDFLGERDCRIVRDRGNWRLEGFGEGDWIAVSGAGANDNMYRIASISGDGSTLNLANDVLLQVSDWNVAGVQVRAVEAPAAKAVGSQQTVLNFNAPGGSGSSGTITRTYGDWVMDGFASGQTIVVSGAGQNDGTYTIAGIDARTAPWIFRVYPA